MSRTGLANSKVKTIRTGFCGRGNDAASHGRCKGALGVRPCVCECHVEPAFAAGLYDGVPEPDYHAGTFGPKEGSLSQSGIKTILRAPELFRYQQQHPVFKKSFDFGSAAHKEVLGAGDPIRVVDAKDWRTNAAKAEAEDARLKGEIPLLKHEHKKVLDMAEALVAHPKASKLLNKTKGRVEVSAYAVDEETGVWRRGRFDFLREDLGIDYKSSVSAHPRAFSKACLDYGYYIQAPYYLDLAVDLGTDVSDFAFIVQEKEPPYLVAVYRLDDEAMDLGRQRIRQALEMFRDCRESDAWPGYAVPENHTIGLPGYAYQGDLA